MYPPHLPSAVVDRLYRAADRLAAEWANAGLADDFGSRMIDAVLRFLARTGSPRTNQTPSDEAELTRYAVALLRRFWIRNARRDAGRAAASRRCGAEVSIDALPSETALGSSGVYAAVGCDVCAGETGRLVASLLAQRGFSLAQAWAFVWRESGRDWDDVAFLLATRLGVNCTEAQLRQWGVRHFRRAKAEVRAHMLEESDHLSEDVTSVALAA